MHPLWLLFLASVTCGVAFVLTQKATLSFACLDGSTVHSLLGRALRLTSLSDRWETLDGPLGFVCGAIRWANLADSHIPGAAPAPSLDDSSVEAGAGHLGASLCWASMKLKRLFVKTSFKALCKRVESTGVYPRARDVFRGRSPKISVDFTTTVFAACCTQLLLSSTLR